VTQLRRLAPGEDDGPRRRELPPRLQLLQLVQLVARELDDVAVAPVVALGPLLEARLLAAAGASATAWSAFSELGRWRTRFGRPKPPARPRSSESVETLSSYVVWTRC